MRLYYVPDQPRMHQTLTLRANVMERGGEPLHKGEVSARIVAPSTVQDQGDKAKGLRRTCPQGTSRV